MLDSLCAVVSLCCFVMSKTFDSLWAYLALFSFLQLTGGAEVSRWSKQRVRPATPSSIWWMTDHSWPLHRLFETWSYTCLHSRPVHSFRRLNFSSKTQGCRRELPTELCILQILLYFLCFLLDRYCYNLCSLIAFACITALFATICAVPMLLQAVIVTFRTMIFAVFLLLQAVLLQALFAIMYTISWLFCAGLTKVWWISVSWAGGKRFWRKYQGTHIICPLADFLLWSAGVLFHKCNILSGAC